MCLSLRTLLWLLFAPSLSTVHSVLIMFVGPTVPLNEFKERSTAKSICPLESLVTLNICRGGSKLIDGCAINATEAVVFSSTVTSS
jgi:hypothetical protein